ncbi:MAG: Transcription termination factor Rho [Parcubacteria group bacterium GW2011_GWA2_50_10b]|nr:MAG: Transcription termination factor Rho [Parcubacteria group bacterium GW2011_GWA2_50_10b]
MAFRASTKSKKASVTEEKPASPADKQSAETPLDQNVSLSGLSIDDLIGGQKEESKEQTVVDVAPKLPQAEEVRPASTQRGEQPVPYRDSPRFVSHDRGMPAGRQGFHRSTQGFGQRGGMPSGRPGYRREWGRPASILDTMPEGHGFLRPKFTPSEKDVYISQSQIRRFLLRNGDMVQGQARQPKDNERYWGLLKVENVNDKAAEEMEKRPNFEDLTPIYPNKQIKLESGHPPAGGALSTRMIDLVAPIGFGQRGLIVSPPKAGKTTILKEMAAGISANYPEVHLMAALIGERPEEVTDLSRSIKGEVLASNFDQSPAEQTRIAEVALDRAKRLVEMGRDVVVLLDSITRLARAYNLVVNPSGRTLSGGFDPAALYPAKRFLGAARCVEGGGSLTVIGTALVETGSRMDDLIYEEFKGTGNMELHLSRILQERRIFPAIDLVKSGTRHDELLLGEEAMKRVVTLRHMLSLLGDEERTLMMIERLTKSKSNDEFLDGLGKG